MPEVEEISELSGEIAGQKFSLKSVALNTLATVATLMGVIGIGTGVYFLFQSVEMHRVEAKDLYNASIVVIKEQTSAIKEGTSIQREQNCLLRFDQKDRQANAEFCKQITR